MSVSKKFFGKNDDGEIFAYTISNEKGLTAEILTLGGIIRRLTYCDTDVVLGRDSVSDYINDTTYFGALIGRNSNRIGNACFELNRKTYTLAKNDGDNNLHGGIHGFNSKIWASNAFDTSEPSLVLKTTSQDGEEGFPGNMEITVTYTLTKENSIKIHYEATTDADTVINMTNHSYFNLNGHNSGDIKSHTLTLNSDFYTPADKSLLPDGTVVSTHNTAFDFTSPKKIGQDFSSSDPQIKSVGGYDHNFILSGRGFRKFAQAEGDKTHIVMECFTDRSGVQLYTSNALENTHPGKDGAEYTQHQAFCLETQDFPNNINYPHFPSSILKKGEKYDTVTEYKFSKK